MNYVIHVRVRAETIQCLLSKTYRDTRLKCLLSKTQYRDQVFSEVLNRYIQLYNFEGHDVFLNYIKQIKICVNKQEKFNLQCFLNKTQCKTK